MTRRTVALSLTVLSVAAAGLAFLLHLWPWSAATRSSAVEVPPAKGRHAIPVPALRFTDVTDAANILFRHFNGATGQKLLPETMGGGVAVLDYDGDGLQDLLFVSGCAWPGDAHGDQPPCLVLYRNKGDGTFEDVTREAGLWVSLYGMGVCVGDFDNDGFPDIYVTAVGGNRLFRNVPGDGGRRAFQDVTDKAGVGGPGGWPKDVEKGAFPGWNKPIAFASSATFLDYDGDGRLDLFVCYYVHWSPAADLGISSTLTGIGRAYLPPTQFEGVQCALYRNVDGTHFKDVSAEAGIHVFEREGTDALSRQRAVGKSLGVIVFDADDDGWPDIVVANDTVRNFFFHNVPGPDGGRRFEEKGLESGVAYAEGKPRGAMGIDWGEFRPGRKALLITNFANEPNTFLSLDDPRRLLFSDAALAVGLAGPSRSPLKFGALFVDCDLDGRLDLFTCNGHLEPEIARLQTGQRYRQPAQLFWNTGQDDRLFEPVTEADSGPDLFRPLVGRGCAVLDFNDDGKPDLVLVENNGRARLLRNDADLGNHWIQLTLDGDGKRSNRSAIGAEVIVEAGGRTMRRQVTGARGYLSQSELPVTVGLADATRVERVTVRWPGKNAGLPQVWTDLQPDRPYVLKQGESRALPGGHR